MWRGCRTCWTPFEKVYMPTLSIHLILPSLNVTYRTTLSYHPNITLYRSILSSHPRTPHTINYSPSQLTLPTHPLTTHKSLRTSFPLLPTGPPKLQQAYLNIINMIFAGNVLSPISPSSSNPSSMPSSPHPSSRPLHDPHDPTTPSPTPYPGESSPRIIAVDQVLHTLREHILRTPSILPSLVRLIDQGGSSAVRGKALITAQLLCRQSPSLLAIFLGERRLPPGDRQ